MRHLSKLKNWAMDVLFPRYCLGCQTEGFYICYDCFKNLPVNTGIACFICGRRSPDGRVCRQCQKRFHPPLNGILVASNWNNILLKELIHNYKYNFVKELGGPLAQVAINFLTVNNFNNLYLRELLIMPVPLHKKRLVWRGFNQAEILAKKISDNFSLKIRSDIIYRTRHSLPQADIADRKNRKNNIKNSFALTKEFSDVENNFLKNKIIILIDDVATTASTLLECAQTLKPLKPKEIWGLVIARG